MIPLVVTGSPGLLELLDQSPLVVSNLTCFPQCAYKYSYLYVCQTERFGVGGNALTSKVNLPETATIVLFTKGNTRN